MGIFGSFNLGPAFILAFLHFSILWAVLSEVAIDLAFPALERALLIIQLLDMGPASNPDLYCLGKPTSRSTSTQILA